METIDEITFHAMAAVAQESVLGAIEGMLAELDSHESVAKEIAITMFFGFADIAWEQSVETFAKEYAEDDDELANLLERRLTLSRIAVFHKYSENNSNLAIIADELKETNDKLEALSRRRGFKVV